MATVYSLICWGGKDGKAVTASSSTDYVTLTNHGLRDGMGVAFTSGTLPSVSGAALALNTTYYAKYISTSTFELYYDSGLTSKIDFTSTGSSLILKGAYYQALADKSRWTYGGSEYIYDGIAAWISARSASPSAFDTEVCEIGEAWDDWITSTALLSFPCAAVEVTTKINGIRTAAFHDKQLGAGYQLWRNAANSVWLSLAMYRATVDGFTVRVNGAGFNPDLISSTSLLCSIRNMIAIGGGAGTGIKLNGGSNNTDAVNCLAINCGTGFLAANNTRGLRIINCTATKNTTGFSFSSSASADYGFYYNNVSVGNTTTNWGATSSGTIEGATNNAGLSTDTIWTSAGGSSVNVTTASFNSWGSASWATTDDFSPASGGALVDAGALYYQPYEYDLGDDERPSYNNGGSEAFDIGAFEFDNGYGPHPANCALTLTNVVSGTALRVEQADGTLREFRTATSSTELFNLTVLGGAADNLVIKARKSSAAPKYLPYQTAVTITAGAQSVYVSQVADEIAA